MLSRHWRDRFNKSLGTTQKFVLRGDKKTKSGRVVSHIEKSIAFNKYRQHKDVLGITDFEFCDLLYTTLDTKPSLRRRNLAELKSHAEIYDKRHLSFLKKCEDHFNKLLMDPRDSNYSGGMMRRKK